MVAIMLESGVEEPCYFVLAGQPWLNSFQPHYLKTLGALPSEVHSDEDNQQYCQYEASLAVQHSKTPFQVVHGGRDRQDYHEKSRRVATDPIGREGAGAVEDVPLLHIFQSEASLAADDG
jgi:hypothetical protein